MGGPIADGQVTGTYPNLALDGPDDVSRGGRLLPTTSVDDFLLNSFSGSAFQHLTLLSKFQLTMAKGPMSSN